jgi:hypothetical protein
MLGLCLLALCGVGALMAGSAWGNWLVKGAEVETNQTVAVKAHTVIEFTVSDLKIEFRCSGIEPVGLKLVALSMEAQGKVQFKTCEMYNAAHLTGTIQPKCKPFDQLSGVSSVYSNYWRKPKAAP